MTLLIPYHKEAITSLSQFVSHVSLFHQEQDKIHKSEGDSYIVGKKLLLFRGHQDCNYELKSSIYRRDPVNGMEYVEYESQFYNEALHNFPEIFHNDRKVIDKLIRMQHYYIPTRLIDLTFSPQVALFFACGGNSDPAKTTENNVDGEILVFTGDNKSISFSGDIDDLVMIGANKKITSQSLFNQLLELLQKFSIAVGQAIFLMYDELTLSVFEKFSDDLSAILQRDNSNLDSKQMILNDFDNCVSQFFHGRGKYFQNSPVHTEKALYMRLLEDYDRIRTHWEQRFAIEFDLDIGIIKPLAISSVFQRVTQYHIIKPTMNNERIKRQQGAFLVHPPAYHQCNLKQVRYLGFDRINVSGIRIVATAKKQILKELEQMGITHSLLFPELDQFTKEIKRRISLGHLDIKKESDSS